MQDSINTHQVIRVLAAGSLRGVLAEIIKAFSDSEGLSVHLETGPSGVLRERIEEKACADLFLSASLEHPQRILSLGLAEKALPFARNEVCLFGNFTPAKDLNGTIDLMLNPRCRLGTSTPGDDPGGDYAFEVFRRVNALYPGAFYDLSAKALQLVGGRNSRPAPEGKHAVQHLFEQQKIDVFLGYYTSALAVKRQLNDISIQKLPEAIRVEGIYALSLLLPGNPAAARFVHFLRSEPGRTLLRLHGFKEVKNHD